MHNWSDEEMDRLSREAAGRYEPPKPEGGWEALSQRLDVEMPVKERKRRAFFWLFFAGLLLGGTLFWSTGHRSGTSTGTQVTQFVTPLSDLHEQVASGSGIKAAEAPVSTATIPAEKKSTTEPSASGTSIPTKHSAPDIRSSNTSFRNGPTARVVHGPVVGVPQGAGTDRKSKVKQYQGKVPPAQARNGEQLPVPARSAGKTSELSPVYSGQEPVASVNVTESDNRQPTTDNRKPITENPQSKTDTPTTKRILVQDTGYTKTKTRKPGRWEFSLGIAPDLSAVEFYPLGKVGIFGGGTVGFHLTGRWTVSTGLYYTIKHYDSPGDDYHLPGYWANNPSIKMKQVNAVCNMWDIPLNIRYDLVSNSRMKVFASTGLSSYLMRKEDLHYYYTYNNNPYDKSYVYSKNKDYWFAIANISAGIEQSIGKGFSLQAEPFAKFSLAEVGTGKIRLNSYGLFVGLKYRPFKVVHPHH